MKISTFILAAVLLFGSVSCNSQINDDYYGYEENYSSEYNQDYSENQEAGFIRTNSSEQPSSSEIVMQTVISSKTGAPFCQMPLPSNWKINNSGDGSKPGISGPNGIEVRDYQGGSYVFINDPYYAQFYQQSGNFRAPAGIQGVIENDLSQAARKLNLTFVNSFPLPGIANSDRHYLSQLYSAAPTQNNIQVAGTEWSDGKGNKHLVIVHYQERMSADGFLIWSYYTNVLKSPLASYENAKKTIIHAFSNIQYNQQAIQQFNYSEQAKLNQSNQAFQQRMRSNQAAFDATQRAHNSANEAVRNSQNAIYNSQNQAFDRGNQQIMNGIREENTLYNPSNGESYQVESGANEYWMNSNGEYIPSDDPNYNPNLDPNFNNQNWERGEIRR